MITVTCDRCGKDVTGEGHWQLTYVTVSPAATGWVTYTAPSDVRNVFCTNCW